MHGNPWPDSNPLLYDQTFRSQQGPIRGKVDLKIIRPFVRQLWRISPTGWSKKRYPGANFAITLLKVHRFMTIFIAGTKKLWRIKLRLRLPPEPPQLYFVRLTALHYLVKHTVNIDALHRPI